MVMITNVLTFSLKTWGNTIKLTSKESCFSKYYRPSPFHHRSSIHWENFLLLWQFKPSSLEQAQNKSTSANSAKRKEKCDIAKVTKVVTWRYSKKTCFEKFRKIHTTELLFSKFTRLKLTNLVKSNLFTDVFLRVLRNFAERSVL